MPSEIKITVRVTLRQILSLAECGAFSEIEILRGEALQPFDKKTRARMAHWKNVITTIRELQRQERAGEIKLVHDLVAALTNHRARFETQLKKFKAEQRAKNVPRETKATASVRIRRATKWQPMTLAKSQPENLKT